jgi:DNA-binding NtrC family response regulator
MTKILAVDDELTSLAIVKQVLSSAGYHVTTALNGEEALQRCKEIKFDIVVTDFNMPGMNGMELTKEVLSVDPDTAVILVTAYSSIKTVVDAIKLGAFDYLTKPVDKDELILSVKRAEEKIKLVKENTLLKQQLETNETTAAGPAEYLTANPGMKEMLAEAKKVASSDSTILITGSNGTGKEVFAKYIFNNSSRKDHPFVVINCAAIPEQLLESELFGHVRGAFTGAVKDKKGYFEISDNGTIFLDEIGEISPKIQVKLLRVLQEREFSRVGDTKVLSTNVRILAATNRNLAQQISEGSFREDLFYRLNVFEFHLPSLFERPEDILFYFEKFVHEVALQNNKKITSVEQNVKNLLMGYNWPGNIRELKNIAERVTILADTDKITADLLPPKFVTNKLNGHSADYNTNKEHVIKNFEINFITKYLKMYKGNVAATARAINFHPVSLRQKLSKLGIHPEKIKYN